MTPAERFVAGLRLRHFSPSEILFRGASDEGLQLNTDPPEDLFENIVRTAWLADLARSTLGSPLRVLSGYRSPAYNKAIGGSAQSLHMKFNALDLGTDRPRELFSILTEFRDARVFKGGIGLYSSFVHIDTRGHNATW